GAGSGTAIAGNDEIRHGGAGSDRGAHDRSAQTIESCCHRVRDRGKSGPNLDGLGRRIPLIKQQQEVDGAENQYKHDRHHDGHFDHHSATLVPQEAIQGHCRSHRGSMARSEYEAEMTGARKRRSSNTPNDGWVNSVDTVTTYTDAPRYLRSPFLPMGLSIFLHWIVTISFFHPRTRAAPPPSNPLVARFLACCCSVFQAREPGLHGSDDRAR